LKATAIPFHTPELACVKLIAVVPEPDRMYSPSSVAKWLVSIPAESCVHGELADVNDEVYATVAMP
jgi:hypothetical protein